MRKLAATFALVILFGSVAHAETRCPMQQNQSMNERESSVDPMPAPPPDEMSMGVGDMPCPMYAQADDDDDSLNPPPPDMMGIGGGKHWRGMERGRKRIEAFRTSRLLELLKLDEATEAKFLPDYKEYREEYREVRHHHMWLVDSLARGLRKDDLDTKQITQMMTTADSLDIRASNITKDFYTRVRPILTAEQLGKLYVFQARFEAEVLERIAEFRRGHEGMPPGPGMRGRQQAPPDLLEDSLK